MRVILVILLSMSLTADAMTMTSDQFDTMLEQAQFIIATWHGVLGAIITILASLLWRRINSNETRTAGEIRDLTQYTRHEIRDLNAAVRQSMELVLTQSRALQERNDRLLDLCNNMQQELSSQRDRLRRYEEK